MDAAPLSRLVSQRLPQHLIATHAYRGQDTAVIKREGLLPCAKLLRDDPAARCDVLMDLTCVDYLKFGRSLHSAPTLATPSPLPYYMEPKPMTETWRRPVSNDEFRFDVVYHFYSTAHNHRVRLKVPLTLADPVVDSLTGLWRTADWFEREAWDMYGVTFTGHPNLRRILLYEEFKGHPLRKDYPIRKRQPLIGPPQ
jgi:NADH-quinone oxidoreductase subunit C